MSTSMDSTELTAEYERIKELASTIEKARLRAEDQITQLLAKVKEAEMHNEALLSNCEHLSTVIKERDETLAQLMAQYDLVKRELEATKQTATKLSIKVEAQKIAIEKYKLEIKHLRGELPKKPTVAQSFHEATKAPRKPHYMK